MKGARLLFIAEVEGDKEIRVVWIKLLSDKATTWIGRGLFKDEQAFKIPGMINGSSNVKIKFSSLDGGVLRRLLGYSWEIAFKHDHVGPWQRPRIEGMKTAAFYNIQIKTGFLNVICTCYRHFFAGGGQGLSWKPEAVAIATGKITSSEYTERIMELMADPAKATFCSPSQGVTKLKLRQYMKVFLQEACEHEIKDSALTSALDSIFVYKIPHGTTERPIFKTRYFKFQGI